MMDQIAEATIQIATQPLDNALRAFLPIKKAWDAIPVAAQKEAQALRTKEQLDIDLNHDASIAKGYI